MDISDIESILQMAGEIRKETSGNLTIGSALSKLNNFKDDEQIILSDRRFLGGNFGSYRGYYEDMYLGYSNVDKEFNTVNDLKEILSESLSQRVLYGYKGGEYPIDNSTLLWLADYGDTGDMIVDIVKVNNVIVIIVKEETD